MKTLRFLIIPVLCMILAVNIAASSSGNGVYEFADKNIVVTFEENSTLTAEEQQIVAERLVYGAPEDDGASTYAWCWLTGHDYKYDVVSIIYHEARPESPRCLQDTYDVETCTKCDHLQEELLTRVYILCCPEEE